MNDSTFTPNTGRRAQTRTFNVLNVYRECGVTTDVEISVVKLTRTESGTVAEINGEAADLDRAVRLLTDLIASGKLAPGDALPSEPALAAQLGISRPTVRLALRTLETRGLVRRDPDPHDRRKHSVALTDAGAELLTNTLPEVRQAELEVTAALSEPEQAQLLALLRRLLGVGETP